MREAAKACDAKHLNRGVAMALWLGFFGRKELGDVGHDELEEYAVVAEQRFEVCGDVFVKCSRAVALFARRRFRFGERFVGPRTCGA